ncbi:RES family NAD+ phosphorylase [Azospirillum sp. YIM B02556]|uniref:RES family NAD+ phosphorylase n=1 Tax=Azospirillum endophyticum TaxID=2800326 RepID=A0ABS1F5Y8_9PROT|nr:RES family NAD+ phosphorylase [Azospirillum endophyticum]
MSPVTTGIAMDQPTHRLIPSRFPPIPAFDGVTRPEDLEAVMELEGWTNDRLVRERVARLPRDQWVYGVANASVVMAAFLHAAPAGGRFNSGELGAWYGAWALKTAIAEVAHHLRREAVYRRLPEMRLTYRLYTARLDGSFLDIRGQGAARPDLYAAVDYRASQAFGEEVRRGGQAAGIVYDSLRHQGGVNAVAYRPRLILEVTQADHYEITAPVEGAVVARRKAL